MTDPEVTGEETGGAGAGEVPTELSRDMSLFDITFIGVGAMIGAGVFALTGFAAGIAGPALTLAFLLNGLVALTTAASYAELGAAFPEAGGGYLWVKEALPDPNGFYAGWMSWFAHAVACSLYAVTFGVFLTEFVVAYTGLEHHFVLMGWITRHMVELAVAVGIIALFAWINFKGAEETGKAGVVVTFIKVVILGAFIAFGIHATVTGPQWVDKFLASPSFAPAGIVGIMGAMGLTYIAFEGYEIIVQSGEEVVDPGKNIPKAVFYSMAIVVPIYILVAFAAIGGIDVTPEILVIAGVEGTVMDWTTWQILGELGELGIIRAADQFMPYGTPLLLFAGLTATMSALNATIYSSSRVSFAMGRDRALPSSFRNVHEGTRTPHVAILWSAVLIAAMALLLPIESVAAAADIMFILLFAQVNLTLIRMRTTHPEMERPYTVPWVPLIPVIGIVLQLILTPFLLLELGLQPFHEGFNALLVSTVWMVGGIIIYLAYSKPREAEKREEQAPTVVHERAAEGRDYRILVPVANPDNVETLMRTALDLARDRDGEVLVMSVVTVPQQTPLSEGRQFIQEEREVLDQALAIGNESEVPVSGTIRIGHSVSQAIINTVHDHDSDVVLLGWRGRKPRRRDVIMGTTIDEVVRKAPCDVLVEKVDGADVDRILVPTAGGPHVDLAARVARSIARATGAAVDVVSVVHPDAPEKQRKAVLQHVRRTAEVLEGLPDVEERVVEGEDVEATLVRLGADADLTILGATREGKLQQLLFGAIPETVASQVPGAVIMAKRNLGVTGTLRHWLRMR